MATPVFAKLSLCAAKQQLSDAYVAAVHDVLRLQIQLMSHFAAGGDGLDRFDLALQAARMKRESAKHRYLLHLSIHGC